jgi:hypothetical protein
MPSHRARPMTEVLQNQFCKLQYSERVLAEPLFLRIEWLDITSLLRKPHASGVAEENAIIVARPDSVHFHPARTLNLKAQAAGLTAPLHERLLQGRLGWVELVMVAESLVDMLAKGIECRQGENRAIHTD